jgi:hypothetical protein
MCGESLKMGREVKFQKRRRGFGGSYSLVVGDWLGGIAVGEVGEGETRRVGRNVSARTQSRDTLEIRACKYLVMRCFKCGTRFFIYAEVLLIAIKTTMLLSYPHFTITPAQ